MRAIDETGNVYGHLTVTGRNPVSHTTKNGVTARWDCICDCGKTTTVRGYDLRSGKQVRCGDCGKKARKRPKGGLYVILSGVNVKIGSSDKIDKRLKTYRDILPEEPELLYWNPHLGHEELKIHSVFEHGYHVRGEWFTRHVLLPDKLPALIKQLEEENKRDDAISLNRLLPSGMHQ